MPGGQRVCVQLCGIKTTNLLVDPYFPICYNIYIAKQNRSKKMTITRSKMITSLHYALDLDHYKLAMCSTEELLDLYNKYCTQ